MDDRKLYEIMGAPTATPAGGTRDGVEVGCYGLVALRTDSLGVYHPDLVEALGQTGYYDDDEWEPYDQEFWENVPSEVIDAIPTEEMDSYGRDLAVVYFGKPLDGEYALIPHHWIRPADVGECLAYSLRAQRGVNVAQEVPEEDQTLSRSVEWRDAKSKSIYKDILDEARDSDEDHHLVFTVLTRADQTKTIVSCHVDYGDEAGACAAAEFYRDIEDALEAGESLELRIHEIERARVIERSLAIDPDHYQQED